MANSYVEIPVTGVDSYTFPFPYLEQSHIKVYAGGVLQTQGVEYTFTDSNTIEFSVGNVPTDTDAIIFIQRVTDSTGRLVNYSNTGLDADDLNLGSNQNFYLAQEANDVASLNITKGADGVTSVNGRLTNVEDPIDDQDAATKAYVASQFVQSVTGSVHIQESQPTSATQGDLWINSTTQVMSVFTPTGWANGGTVESEVYNFTGADLIPFGLYYLIFNTEVGVSNIDQVFLNGVLIKECTTPLDFTTGDWDRTTSFITLGSGLTASDDLVITTTTRMSTVLSNAVVNVSNKIDTLLNLSTSGPAAGITLKESFIATASQTVFNLVNSYQVGTNNISVYLNGVRQSEYTETDATTITFTNPLTANDEIEFFVNEFNASVFEQSILADTETARDEAVAAKVAAELIESTLEPQLLPIEILNGGNIVSVASPISIKIDGGTGTNYLTALDGVAEVNVVSWTDDVFQVSKPISLVSPNGLVVKELSINNSGQLVFDGTVIS